MELGKRSLFVRWLGLYFACLILGAMNIGAFGSMLKVLAAIPVGIWLLQRHRIAYNRLLLWAACFVFCCGASYVWSIVPAESLSRIGTQILYLCMLAAASGYSYSSDDLAFLKSCLIWSSRFTAIIVLLSSSYLEGRIYLNGIVREDPNYLCAYFLFGIAEALDTALDSKILKKRLIAAVELIVYVYIVIGSGSRGGLLAVLMCASIVFFLYGNGKQQVKTIAKKIAVIIAVCGVVLVASAFISGDILQRFSLETLRESNGTGRFDLWQDALSAFSNSGLLRQLFGYGTASARTITWLFPFRRHNVFHNIFVEVLLELGVIGLIAYVLHIFSMVSFTLKRKEHFAFSIVMGMIILSLSTSIFAFKPYWNIAMYIFCIRNEVKPIHETEHHYPGIQR